MQTIPDLLLALEECGLAITLENGAPRLRGNTGAVTETLMRTLKDRRTEIIAHLQQQTYWHREWLDEYWNHLSAWDDRTRFGDKTTCEAPPFRDMNYHPKGAKWVRFMGEREWQPVDTNETLPTPPPEAPGNIPEDELWRYL